MKKSILCTLIAAASLVAAPALAGGRLEQIDLSTATPTDEGLLLVDLVGIRWDPRAIPVHYRVNDITGPKVPNPLGEPLYSLQTATAALQQSFDRWNELPTSYIDLQIVGQITSTTPGGFDFVNELSFATAEGFGAIAFSPSVSLAADVCLVGGEDINGDGTADVSADIAVVTEIGGQNVFPAGCYPAGTILDNDVLFNTKQSSGYRFTLGDGSLDTEPRSVDLETVATHEFGHSHGLSHVLTNQRGPGAPRGAVMFPFIDTADPNSEREQRGLDTDDEAISSLIYQEGSDDQGPAALQPGDRRFSSVYGLIQGTVTNDDGNPVAGANVFAVDRRTREKVSSNFSGSARVLVDPATGGLFVPDPENAVASGSYTVPVRLGLYSVAVQPVDGLPVSPGSINLTAQIGSILGQMTFDQAYWNLRSRLGLPPDLGQALPVPVLPGYGRDGIDFATVDTFKAGNVIGRFSSGFTDLGPGAYYVVRVPIQTIIDNFGGRFSVQSALFETRVVDGSVVPRFSEAMITTGRVDADLNILEIDLDRPLVRDAPFIGQDNDFSPLYPRSPIALGIRIQRLYRRGNVDSLFLVLRLPTEDAPFPGPTGFPPLVGLGIGNSPGVASYFSEDGVNFTRVGTFGFRFQLALTPSPF